MAASNKKNVIRVLHVDDDPIHLEISKQILMDMGAFEIDHTCCVDEAFKKLSTGNYDVVISDYEMPEKNGLQLLKDLREGKIEIPFILFTGKGREEVVVKALNLGADSYINKNGSPETVYYELADALNKTIERTKSKKALVDSELKYRAYVENSPLAFMVGNSEGKLEEVNGATCKMLGYSGKELLEMTIVELVFKEDLSIALKQLSALKDTGKSLLEFRLKKKDGQSVYVNINVVKLPNERLMSFCEDITERKKAEQALDESEEKYRKLFEESMSAIFLAETETGIIIDCNSAATRLVGRSKSELVGQHQSIFTPQEEMEGDVARVFKQHLKDQTKTLETKITRKTGEIRNVAVNDTIVELNGKKLMQRTLNDITERKKAEKALIVSEKNYRNLINGMGESAWVGDFEGNFVEVNNAAIEMLGYSREELLSLGIKGIDNYLTPEQVKNSANLVVSGKNQVFETVHTSKNGLEIPVEISSSLITYQEKPAILAIARNITERKKAEESLRKSEEENSSLFANMSDCFAYCQMVFDDQEKPVDFVYLQINDAFENITGLKRDLVVEKRVTQAIPGIKEANPELFEIYGRVALTGKKEKIELFFKPLRLWLSISVYCPRKGYFAALFEDITQRKKVDESLKESEEKFRNLAEESPNAIFINKKGRVLYANKKCEDITGYNREELYSPNFNFLSLYSPEYVEVMRSSYAKHMIGEDAPPYDYVLMTKGGERIDVVITSKLINYNGDKAILGIVTDISELKKAQETLSQTMNELVSVNEKLGVVGSLTRHDVRNKLSAINGYAYLLKKKHNDQVDILDGLSKIEQSVQDSVKIFEFAKMYEQLGVEELNYVDVGKAVEEAAALFSGLTIKILNDCYGRSVLADSLLRQMFYNFIDNTRKYGVKATTIKVYYRQEESGKLNLIYEDDGVGISAENKSRLFTEGFSTGGSTGFGLFLIKKMMDVYGWSIIEEGEPGKGAKFTITIPK